MGQTFSQYNPLTEMGRYNLRNYVYQNKRTVTVVLVILILLVLIGMYFLYSGGSSQVQNQQRHRSLPSNIPPPAYGYGPYGYGLYLPPESVMAESLE